VLDKQHSVDDDGQPVTATFYSRFVTSAQVASKEEEEDGSDGSDDDDV
jgi:hypothetical protein